MYLLHKSVVNDVKEITLIFFLLNLRSEKRAFLTIFILLVLGVHIAKVEPRQGRLSVMLPAVFIYIFYLSLLILARESFIESSKDTHNYIWLVHTLFLSLGLFSIFKLNFYKKLQFIDSIKKSNILKIVLLVAICLIFLWISK